MEIRGFTVKYTKTKAKRRKNEELTLQNKINELQLSLERNPNNNHAQNELLAAKLRLQKIMHFKTKGAILRSKVRWYEEGQCNTRYFFSLENRAQTKKGVNSLIPKKNKDKSILENLRPISLLNVDYKILTKVISKRIEKTLPKIINPDQTGYVKGRYIGENIRLIQDVMFLTKRLNMPGIAIFLDFRKAFDTIKWNYLLSTLRLFNFGPDLQRWIEVIYHVVSSCVLNNGHASPFFQLHRGVRQGCPLSGLLCRALSLAERK